MPEVQATVDGLVTIESSHKFGETVDRLEAAIKARTMTVFARIDHAAGAAQAGLDLRPTQLVVFGNAKGGTPLMQEQQTVGIDLPLKVLVWSDAMGAVRLSYNDPHWIARRHGLGAAVASQTTMMATALAGLVKEVAADTRKVEAET